MVRRLLKDHPEIHTGERWTVVMTSAVHELARYQNAWRAGTLASPLDDLIDDFVRFLAAGLGATLLINSA
jgi:hypothetical protein